LDEGVLSKRLLLVWAGGIFGQLPIVGGGYALSGTIDAETAAVLARDAAELIRAKCW